jgi:DNA-binding CsgD family transcriptional regulator
MNTAPRRVLADLAELSQAVREANQAGWRVHRGFAVPDEPWDLAPARVVLAGPLGSEADAKAALLGAVRGAGLLVQLDRTAEWAGTFLADLVRLSDSDSDSGGPGPGLVAAPAGAAAADLTPEQRQILDLLAGGASIAQAARQLFWSLRTANRRVAAARDALGVTSTQEAVVAYSRLRGR